MTNHRHHEQFLRQANRFEKIVEMLGAVGKTDENRGVVQVAEGMVKVCEILAEIAEEEAWNK